MARLEMNVGMGLAALSALALALTGCADTDDEKPYSELTVGELVAELAEDGLLEPGATVIVQEGTTLIDQGDRLSMKVDQPLDLEPGRYRVTGEAGRFGLELEEGIDRG